MQPEILDALYRLIGEYGWNWGMARNLINRQFGTNYTIKELQRFYMRRPRPKPDTVSDKRIMENPRRAAFTARWGFLIAACRPCSGQMSNSSQSSSSDRPQMNGSVIASSTECASTA